MTRPSNSLRGFTLIEMIMVIVITGVIAGMVAIFIKGPVDSYIDMARRAELTDIADTAVRRMARDIRLALPNSSRQPADGSDQCIEFMPTKSGGRYRAAQTGASTGDILNVGAVDASFDMLGLNGGLPAAEQLAAGDVVVVSNLSHLDTDTTNNAYAGGNAIRILSTGAGDTANTTKINFVAAGATLFALKALPSAWPAYRFQVLPAAEQVVSYACNIGSGTLLRYSRDIRARTTMWATPATCAAMTAAPTAVATLANHVSSCSIVYNSNSGIVSISLAATESGETVNLYHQVHVDNPP